MKNSGQFKKTHGYGSHPLYRCWYNIKNRCENKQSSQYHNYGERGILICDDWDNPIIFVKWGISNGWEKGLTVERIDNDKGYSPDNCRFITRQQKLCNKRKYKSNASGYIGVSRHKCGSYTVFMQGKYLGSFKTAKIAALYRDAYNLARGGFLPYSFKQTEV